MHAEDRLLGWLRRQLRRRGDDLVGDDAAFLPPLRRPVVTVDQQIAGVHFPDDLDAVLVARRLLAVNLSDLAACGALPRYAVAALTVPAGYPLRRFFSGLLAACRRHGVSLAGGDLARGAGFAAALTLIGEPPARGRPVGRDGGRPGDALWVGGSLGESALGRLLLERGARPRGRRLELPSLPTAQAPAARRAVRRHLEPPPQLALGAWLSRRRRAAAIDVSDGLGRDLERLCAASATGAEVHAGALPTAPGFDRLARRLGACANALVLGGGEDYVLLFALPPTVRPPTGLGAVRIGSLVRGRRRHLLTAAGRTTLPASGWDHLASA